MFSQSDPKGVNIDDDYGDFYEPDLDFQTEWDTAMDSIGWGEDEHYRPEMDHLEDW